MEPNMGGGEFKSTGARRTRYVENMRPFWLTTAMLLLLPACPDVHVVPLLPPPYEKQDVSRAKVYPGPATG